MSKIGIFMAEGCEEIEGLTVVDIVRRAGLEIEMISITDKAEVTSSHNVTFKTETVKTEADYETAKQNNLVLPNVSFIVETGNVYINGNFTSK